MRTLFLDYFAQSLVLGLAILALLAAAPLLQKRYSGRWFCRAWLALAVLLVLPLRAVLPENAPATITLTPPAALLAAEEPSEAPAPLTTVPGPDTEHLTAPSAFRSNHCTGAEHRSGGRLARNGLSRAGSSRRPFRSRGHRDCIPLATGGLCPARLACPALVGGSSRRSRMAVVRLFRLASYGVSPRPARK